jgi:galactonate dehydratase
MQITRVETFLVGNPWKNWVFVKVHTNEGLYGIGEGTVISFAKTVETAIHELFPFIVGMDPMQIELILQKLVRDPYADGAQIQMAAVAAIETACWDIAGKVLNQPIYNLWGGRCHQKLRAYANGWYRGERNPELFSKKALEVVRRGYTALKFDPFGSAWRTLSSREFALSIEIIAAIRAAVGDEVDILIEGHSRFMPATAIQIAKAIEPFRPMWFEEPVHHGNISALIEVARQSPVPIATGESFSNKHQFAELLKHDVVSIYQPEPLNLGGIFAARKIADAVDAHYGVVAPHSAQGPVATAACAQLNACTPNFLIHEFFDDFNEPWVKEILRFPVECVDGYITVPDRPGLGIDLNCEEMAKHPYSQKYHLPLFKSGWEKREPQ